MRQWVWVKAPAGERAYVRRQSPCMIARTTKVTSVLEPPLRLQLAPFEAVTHAAVVGFSSLDVMAMHEASAGSPFGRVTPGAFWLDGVLEYLPCEEWVGLLLVSRGWCGAVSAASAWDRADVGLAVERLGWSGAQKRRLVCERRAARHSMAKAWEDVCRFSPLGVRWTLRDGLGEGTLQDLEAQLGLVLPPHLRASFRTHNGQVSNARSGLLGEGRLLSLQEVVREVAAQAREEQPRRGPVEGFMLPVSDGYRGRQLFCHVLGNTEGEGGVYLVTALHMTKLASSWANYLAEIR